MFKTIFVLYCVIWQVLLLPLNSNRNVINENDEENRIETINQQIVPDSVLISLLQKDLKINTFHPKAPLRSKRNNGKVKERYRWPNATVPVQIDSLVISIYFDFQ
jgi:hypothetical protein